VVVGSAVEALEAVDGVDILGRYRDLELIHEAVKVS